MPVIGNMLINLIARTAGFDRAVGRSKKSLRQMTAETQALNRGLLQLGASVYTFRLIGRAMSDAVRESARFESQLSEINTLLVGNLSNVFPRYERSIKSMAVEFGQGTETLSRGLYDVVSAVIDTQKALGVLEVGVKSARAGFVTTAQAMDPLLSVMKSYNVEADKAGTVADIIFSTIRRGRTTMAELSTDLGKLSSISATAGVDFNALAAAISSVTRTGLRTDLTITGLRSGLKNLIKPTDEARFVANLFGVELNRAALEGDGLIKIAGQLKGVTIDLLQAIIPNTRGLAAWAALIREADGAMEDLRLTTSDSGQMLEAYEKVAKTTQFQLDRASEALTAIKRGLGDFFAPIAREWSEGLAEFVTVYGDSMKDAGNAVADAMEYVQNRFVDIVGKEYRWQDAHQRATAAFEREFGHKPGAEARPTGKYGRMRSTDYAGDPAKIARFNQLFAEFYKQLEDVDKGADAASAAMKKFQSVLGATISPAKQLSDITFTLADATKAVATETKLEKELSTAKALYQAHLDVAFGQWKSIEAAQKAIEVNRSFSMLLSGVDRTTPTGAKLFDNIMERLGLSIAKIEELDSLLGKIKIKEEAVEAKETMEDLRNELDQDVQSLGMTTAEMEGFKNVTKFSNAALQAFEGDLESAMVATAKFSKTMNEYLKKRKELEDADDQKKAGSRAASIISSLREQTLLIGTINDQWATKNQRARLYDQLLKAHPSDMAAVNEKMREFDEIVNEIPLRELIADSSGALAMMLEDAILKTKTWKQALRDVGQQLTRMIVHAAVTNPLQQGLNSMFLHMFNMPVRSHTGYNNPLKPGEQMHIVQQGEGIIPKNQVAAIRSSSASRSGLGGAGMVEVRVKNEGIPVETNDVNIFEELDRQVIEICIGNITAGKELHSAIKYVAAGRM